MNSISFKFNIGEKVSVMISNKIHPVYILGRRYDQDGEYINITYTIGWDKDRNLIGGDFNESVIFKTKEDLLKSL